MGADRGDVEHMWADIEPSTEDARYMWRSLWENIAPGFDSLGDVLFQAEDSVDDGWVEGLTAEEAKRIARLLWDRRSTQIAEEGPGDDVAVLAALAELESAGIAVDLNTGADREDGHHNAADLARRTGAWGYAFAHFQDIQRLAYPDADLYLGYDVLPPDGRGFATAHEWRAAAVPLGQRIVDVMRSRGLTVEWNGTAESRPAVTHLTWRKPLPTDPSPTR